MINNFGAMQYSLMNSDSAYSLGKISDTRAGLIDNVDKMSPEDVFTADKKLDQEQAKEQTRYLVSDALADAADKKNHSGKRFGPYYG